MDGLWKNPPLLLTESEQEFDELAAAMVKFIAPENVFEELFTVDAIKATWVVIRYQRVETAMINIGYRQALINLLDQEICVADEIIAEQYADGWFKTKAGREEVMTLLKRYHLDETAIEAEAVKLVGPELEKLNLLLSAAERQRARALRAISEVRSIVVKRAREISQQMIEKEGKVDDNFSEAAE